MRSCTVAPCLLRWAGTLLRVGFAPPAQRNSPQRSPHATSCARSSTHALPGQPPHLLYCSPPPCPRQYYASGLLLEWEDGILVRDTRVPLAFMGADSEDEEEDQVEAAEGDEEEEEEEEVRAWA